MSNPFSQSQQTTSNTNIFDPFSDPSSIPSQVYVVNNSTSGSSNPFESNSNTSLPVPNQGTTLWFSNFSGENSKHDEFWERYDKNNATGTKEEIPKDNQYWLNRNEKVMEEFIQHVHEKEAKKQ